MNTQYVGSNFSEIEEICKLIKLDPSDTRNTRKVSMAQSVVPHMERVAKMSNGLRTYYTPYFDNPIMRKEGIEAVSHIFNGGFTCSCTKPIFAELTRPCVHLVAAMIKENQESLEAQAIEYAKQISENGYF